jgi:acyl-coenzyme A thioesterase 9
MDSMAGYIAFLHCDDGDPSTLPPLLVTAAVERIEIIHAMDLAHDATLCAPPCLWFGFVLHHHS